MSSSSPNILLVITDQQHAGMLGCAGNRHLSTPAMDTVAAEGVRFTNAACTDPVCLPSRTGMITGMMPCRLGAGGNRCPDAMVPPEVLQGSLGMVAQAAGYHTVYSGKVHLACKLKPTAIGFAVQTIDERGALPDECLAAIDQRDGRPFLAVASLINPHDICFAHIARGGEDRHGVLALYEQACALSDDELPPLPDNFEPMAGEPSAYVDRLDATAVTPAAAMRAEYSERDWRIYRWIYHRLTEVVDAEIGRLLDGLRVRGILDDTLVICLSDHGNMDASHTLSSKMLFYEESVGVPLLMRLPGSIPAGRIEERLASVGLDLLPTICDYLGAAVPEHALGRSWRPVAEGRTDVAWHDFIPAENNHGRMIRSPRYKYCSYGLGDDDESLVDMQADRGESQNLVHDPAHAEALARHRAMLHEWVVTSRDEAWHPQLR